MKNQNSTSLRNNTEKIGETMKELQNSIDVKFEQFMKNIEWLINSRVLDSSIALKSELEYHRRVLICGATQEDDYLYVATESMGPEYDENDNLGEVILHCKEENVNQSQLQNQLFSPVVDNDRDPTAPEVGNCIEFQAHIEASNFPIHPACYQFTHNKVKSLPKIDFVSHGLTDNTTIRMFYTNQNEYSSVGKVFDEIPRSVLNYGYVEKEGYLYVITNQYPPKYNDSGGKAEIPTSVICGITKEPKELIVGVANKLVVVESNDEPIVFKVGDNESFQMEIEVPI